MINYPVAELGRYPNTWIGDNGELMGRDNSVLYGVIDPRGTATGATLTSRRINYTGELPLAPLNRVYNNITEFMVGCLKRGRPTKFIDSLGKIYEFRAKHKVKIECFPIDKAVINETGEYVIHFIGTLQRVRVIDFDREKLYGAFVTHPKYGEIMLGLSKVWFDSVETKL